MALLDYLETEGEGQEILRLWEPTDYAVILGASCEVEREVNREACEAAGIAILRRPSGGCAVVGGPGCLMYSLFLSLEQRPWLRLPEDAHQWVLTRMAETLNLLVPGIARRGISDLAWGERKIAGQSIRRKRRSLLYHGSILYAFPLELIGRVLKMPPRQPQWRACRSHTDFLANLPVKRHDLERVIIQCWNPAATAWEWPGLDRYLKSTTLGGSL